jgi:hypothetical protein
VPKGQPYVSPVIVEPEQIARVLHLASQLSPTKKSPLRAGPGQRPVRAAVRTVCQRR